MQRIIGRIHVALAIAAAACAFAVRGDVNFPATGGDISAAATWGGSLPGTGDAIVFTNAADVTVTAANDAQFGLLKNTLKDDGNHTLMFDLRDTPSRKLSFNGFQMGEKGSKNISTAFRSGTYDFGGSFFGNGGGQVFGDGHFFYVSDGAVLTNIAVMRFGYTGQSRLRMEVSGGSCVYLNDEFKFTNNKTSKGNENWLEITGGSLFHTTGPFTREDAVNSWANSIAAQPEGGLHYKDHLTVSGRGSRLVVNNSVFYLGWQGGAATYFTDHAVVTNTGDAHLWSRYTRNNLIRVSDGAYWRCQGVVYGGHNTPAEACGDRHNLVEILSGGELDAGGNFELGYIPNNNNDIGNCGNTLVISNGTLRTYTLRLGRFVSCSNQLAVLQGPEARLIVTAPVPFAAAPFCEYRVELGAKFAPPGSFGRYSAGTRDCIMRARSGGILDIGSFFTTAADVAAANIPEDGIVARSNAIIAEAGGVVTGKWLAVQGDGCSLRVDDSLVALTNAATALTIGHTSNGGGISTNCVLAIAGRAPQIRLSGGMTVANSSKLRFELPADGYAAVPVVAEGAVSLDDSSSLEFTGVEEMSARHRSGIGAAEYVLVDNPQAKGFFSDAAVEAAQAALGDDIRLKKRVKDGRNQLVLKIGRKGAVIIFK